MKESLKNLSLKGIILYNARFPNNHPKLFEKCKQYEAQGKLKMFNYKKFLKTKEHVKDLINNVDDILELIPLRKQSIVERMTFKQAIERMQHSPKAFMKSVISLWYCPELKMYTRIDIGEVELKYLIEHEERNPKGKK